MSSSSSPDSKPSLAILDDYLNLSASHFQHLIPHLSKISYYPDTISAKKDLSALISRLKPYNIICSMRERTAFPREVLTELPNLRLLLTTGKRNASIDVKACEDHNIPLAGTTGSKGTVFAPGYDNVNEHCWALILALAKGVPREDKATKEGHWQTGASISLNGGTLGILGLGRLGAALARTAVLGFGMKILAWSANLTQEKADESSSLFNLPPGTFTVSPSKEYLLSNSDILSVQLVLSPRTRHIISTAELDLLKPSALLVNTSRGPIVDEEALYEHLSAGKIRGAALDVFSEEPLPHDSKWRSTRWGEEGRSEVILTPHTGYAVQETLDSWYQEQAENVERWLRGEELVTRFSSENTGYKK